MLKLIIFTVLICIFSVIKNASAKTLTQVADHLGEIDLEKVPFSASSRLGKAHTDDILKNIHAESPVKTFSVSTLLLFLKYFDELFVYLFIYFLFII